jgi:hypothetical protein
VLVVFVEVVVVGRNISGTSMLVVMIGVRVVWVLLHFCRISCSCGTCCCDDEVYGCIVVVVVGSVAPWRLVLVSYSSGYCSRCSCGGMILVVVVVVVVVGSIRPV